MTEKDPFHNPSKGIPLVLIASFSNSIMATCAKMATCYFPFMTVVFARFGLSLVLTLLALPFFLIKKKPKDIIKIKSWPISLVRVFASIACLVCYYFSLKQIPLSTAVVLVMCSPLYIPLINRIWLKNPIRHILWFPLLIGFLGVLLIVGPNFMQAESGLIMGVASGIFAAISYASGREQAKIENTFAIAFWMYLFGSLLAFPFFLMQLEFHSPSLQIHWPLLVLVALFGLLYQLFLIFAFRVTRSHFVGSFLYFTIIFALIFDWYFFNLEPTLVNYIGVFLVALSGILMTFFDSSKIKKL